MLRRRAGFLLLALAASLAAATDRPAKAQPAPAWSGFYAGVTAGYAFASDSANLDPAAQTAFDGLTDASLLGSKGFSAGGLVGYNWLVSRRWLAGIEADASWQNIKITASSEPNQSSAVARQKWAASLRGRIGYLTTPGTLVYGTAGWAWSRIDGDITIFGAPTASASGNVNGLQAGVGVETVLADNWRGRLEYLHTLYYNGNLPNSDTTGVTAIHPSVGLVRLGAIYQFGRAHESAAWTEPRAGAASWRGFYIGGSLGGAVGYGDFHVPGEGDVKGVGLAGPLPTVFVGYNYLVAPRWLIGAEAELGPSVRSTDLELGWFGAVRGRFGYLLTPDTLVYGTTGWTGTQIDDIVVSNVRVASRQTINGIEFGGGVESAFSPRWSARVDYQYAIMQTVDVTVPSFPPARTSTSPRGHVGRIALVRRFSGD